MSTLPILVTDNELAHHLAYGIATDPTVHLETDPEAVDGEDTVAEWANEEHTIVRVRIPYLNWGMEIGIEVNPANSPEQQRENWDETGTQVAAFTYAPTDFVDDDELPEHVADAL